MFENEGDEGGGGDGGAGAPAGGTQGAPAGGTQGTPSQGAGAKPAGGQGAGGAQAFSVDTWDGDVNKLTDPVHKGILEKFRSSQNGRAEEEARAALAANLRAQFNQPRPQAQRQPGQGQPGQPGQQVDDKPLTQAQLNQELQRREADSIRAGRLKAWQDGMVEIVEKPQKFGDATVTFASQKEVDDFNNYVKDTFDKGLTPRQLLALYRQDAILKSHGEASVKGFEKTLGQRGTGGGGGTADPKKPLPNPNPVPGTNKTGRVPDTATFLKESNPALYEKIMAGQLNLTDGM